ncbi:MAG TPA: hypothetical protein VMF90_17575 [Rhizobiaceae bacterium]|nr:hypothetical protein [Rhizobiaceae bacterium]
MLRFTAGLIVGAALMGTAFAQMAVTVPTNGKLVGYIVQKDGNDVCRDPDVFNEFRGPDSYIICP